MHPNVEMVTLTVPLTTAAAIIGAMEREESETRAMAATLRARADEMRISDPGAAARMVEMSQTMERGAALHVADVLRASASADGMRRRADALERAGRPHLASAARMEAAALER